MSDDLMRARPSSQTVNPAQWFHDHSVGVFPIREKSKEPACRSWDDYICSRDQAARFRNYGVRLGTLVVADPDSDDAKRWCMKHLPHSPFYVFTSRGVHVYYRLTSGVGVPKFIHRDGLTIEFRHAGRYVVGPESVHPSGAVYRPCDWSWRWDDIPVFDTASFTFNDGSCGKRSTGVLGEPYEFPQVVSKGERHAELFKLLRSLKAQGYVQADARQIISFANEHGCRPSLPEDHIFNAWFERAWANPDRPMPSAQPLSVNWGVF